MLAEELPFISIVVAVLAIPFMIWELFVLLTSSVINTFIEKKKKVGRDGFENGFVIAYTFWMIIVFFFASWAWAIVLAVLASVSGWVLRQNWYTQNKVIAMKIDAILSLIVLWMIFRNVL